MPTMRLFERRYQALISQLLHPCKSNSVLGDFNTNSICVQYFLIPRRHIRSNAQRVDSKETSSDELHDQFLSNLTEDAEEAVDSCAKHVSSVRSTKPYKSPQSKERFARSSYVEGDMYSGKPVWQQLNEIESTWNMHFRHKGRIQAQKAITKAKKRVETLDAIESNQAKLVNLDCFREALDQHGRDTGAEASKGESALSDGRGRTLRSVGDGHVNTPLRVTSKVSTISEPRWMNKDDEDDAFTDEVGFNRHHGKMDITDLNDSRRLKEELKPAPLISDEKSLREANGPSLLLNDLINEEDRAKLGVIFGDGNDSLVDSATPAAVIEATTRLEPETWLNMNPAHIVLQQSILKCKSTSQLLMAIEGKIDQMNHVNISTALHRLGRYSNPNSRYLLNNNETFDRLVAAVATIIPKLDTQGLTNIFWSLVRLRIKPPWLDKLMDALNKVSKDLGPTEVASCLFAISKVPVKTPIAVDLRDSLIGHAQAMAARIVRPLDITCMATALARLNVRNPILFGQICKSTLANIESFNMQHICGIAWAFASLGFTDRTLFRRIRKFVEETATSSSIRDVVHLAWALSKIGEADSELFLGTISPLVRSHIGYLSCRDITTVAWAYVHAEIDDEDLFEDLASGLQHHVDEMTTQDIAAAVAAFAHMEESHRSLFKKMRNRAFALSHEFTPLQLSKIVRGFSSVADERFHGQMAKAVESKIPQMLPENIVEILMGFTETGYKAPQLYKKLLDAVSAGSRKMYAEDALLLLQVVTNLKQEPHDHAMSSTLHKVAYGLIEQIEKRVGRWKCYDAVHMASFFRCLSCISVSGSKGDSAVKTFSRHFVSCLNRLFNNRINAEKRNKVFADFLEACAHLPARKLALIQAEMSKNTQLMISIHNCVASLRSGAHLGTIEAKVDAAYDLIRLGYCDDSVIAICDDIAAEYQSKEDAIAGAQNLEVLSRAIWLLTEANLHIPWVKKTLRSLSNTAGSIAEPSDALVRLMWSSVVLGEDDMLMEMLRHYVPLFNKLPGDIFLVQQVALHVTRFLLPKVVNNGDAPMVTKGIDDDAYTISREIYVTLQDWLDYQRDDLYTVSPGSKRKRTLELDYDSVISECLIAMKIPHKTVHTVENIYRVSASFPLENHIIDVMDFTDCFVPTGRPRATALLRQRQLQLLGYGIASLKLDKLYEATREKRHNELIAETISGFCTTAMEYLPPSKQQG